jgi:hypothetical protein
MPLLLFNVFHDFVAEGFVVVYLDDVLIFSKTEEEHKEHLQKVFERLREEKLFVKLKKCSFCQPELRYLGFIVGKHGIKIDPDKVAAVMKWVVPTTATEVRQFLGLCNFSRKFVQGYSQLAAPLDHLLRKGVPWLWTDACQKAFDGLKWAITNAPVLAIPDLSPDAPKFRVVCDASKNGVGAVLEQNGRPCAYMSRKFSDAERNYHVTEQELAAVCMALTDWRCYLLGKPFEVVTDHAANTFLPSQSVLSPRQARWSELLQMYSIGWKYEPGRTNVADPLSRNPSFVDSSSVPRASVQVRTAMGGRGIGHRIRCAVLTRKGARSTGGGTAPPLGGVVPGAASDSGDACPDGFTMWCPEGEDWLHRIRTAYEKDHLLKDGRKRQRAKLVAKDGYWFRGKAMYVPEMADGKDKELKEAILKENHEVPQAGHVGRTKMLEKIQRYFWWPKLREGVEDFLRVCDACQRNKVDTSLPAGLLQPLPIPSRRWESISMDFITDLPKTVNGNDAILVVVDRLSKYAHFIPTTDQLSAEGLADVFVDRVFKLHGMPKQVLTDRGTVFTSAFTKALFKILGTRSVFSTAYHPQTDGQTERVNRIVEDMLRHYVSPTQHDWDVHVPAAEFAYNNAYQESVRTTPFRLVYGEDPIEPFAVISGTTFPSAKRFAIKLQDDLALAKRNLIEAQDRQRTYANQGRRHVEYEVGEEILLSTKNIRWKHPGTKKFLPRFIGPFKILARIGAVAYRLELPDEYTIHNVFHVSLLKPYHKGVNVAPSPPPDWIDGDWEYDVGCILMHREKKAAHHAPKKEYLVKWKGYGPERNSWEPEAGLIEHAQEVVQEYWAGRALNEKVGIRKRTTGVSAAGHGTGTGTKKRTNEHASATKNTAPKKRRN